MKKFLAIVAVATTLTFCNTPQPTTTPDGTDTTMMASPTMTDTSSMMTDTTQRRDTMRLQ